MKFAHRAARYAGGVSLLLASAAASAAVPLTATVEAVQDKALAGSGQVRYTLTNNSDRAVVLLRWQTPLGDVTESFFQVKRNGVEVPYTGRHVKRAALSSADFMVLGAGESDSVVVDLAKYYDMSVAGQYEVSVDSHLDNVFVETSQEKLAPAGEASLRSGATIVWLDSANVSKAPDLSWQALMQGKAVSFSGACTSSEQTAINTAHNSAKTYAANSLTYLNGGTVGPRYTTWFGAYTYTSSRYATVRSHFAAIKDAVDNKSVVYDCSCSENYYAYVYPTQPYKVYLCNAFWSANNTGTDSRAGTIIHEISHFNVVAATDDHAYGQTAAKRLAQQNPKRAIDNADNHEYFAENTPAQN
jgi:peptidyl-Lys metalloendopeptidase